MFRGGFIQSKPGNLKDVFTKKKTLFLVKGIISLSSNEKRYFTFYYFFREVLGIKNCQFAHK